MDGISILRELGCCPRCILVHSGVKDSEHYTTRAAVLAAIEALVEGTLTGLLGGDQQNNEIKLRDNDNKFQSGIITTDDVSVSNSLNMQVNVTGNVSLERDCDTDSADEADTFVRPICVSCLGLLQDDCCSKATIQEVCSLTLCAGYDAPSFSLSTSLPSCMSLRAHLIAATYAKGTGRQPFTSTRCGATGLLKDAWKWSVSEAASAVLQKTCNSKAGLIAVPVRGRYAADGAECQQAMKALNYKGPFLKPQRNRRQKHYKYKNNSNSTSGDVLPVSVDPDNVTADDVDEDGEVCISRRNSYRDPSSDVGNGAKESVYSRQAIENVLLLLSHEDLLARCPWPTAPLTPLTMTPEKPSRMSVFVAGRYRKMSRELSQTPWLIAGQLKCESSVEQLIAKEIMPALGAQELKFLSSGREDVDVRCLGRGRPFALEIHDPLRGHLDALTMATLQKRINEGTSDISVHHLQIIDRESTSVLRFDTENKVKNYCALCFIRQAPGAPLVTQELLQKLQGLAPLTLQQQTPIRVLHRRPLLTRPRTLHTITATRVSDAFFKVYLRTEAGTYIKELVHGDFGRTSPSLSSILGCQVDISALDVTDIELDWPPPVTTQL